MTSRRSARLASQSIPAAEAMEVDEEPPAYMEEDDEPQPGTSSGTRPVNDSDEDEDYGQKEPGRGRKSTGVRKETVGTGRRQKKTVTGSDLGLVVPHEEILKNSLHYLMLLLQKNTPAKKSDIIKFAMNGQTRDFEAVFKDLEGIFSKIFGMKLYGAGETQKTGLSSYYFLVSNFNLNVCNKVTLRDRDVDCRRAILFLLLTIIFMQNRSIDEELIWTILVSMKFHTMVCERKEHLRKFLKQEYVNSMYLVMEEDNEIDPPVVEYGWGFRAEKEFSKYSILKYVTKQFPGKKPIDFTVQYGHAKQLEGAIMEADALIDQREADEAENVSDVWIDDLDESFLNASVLGDDDQPDEEQAEEDHTYEGHGDEEHVEEDNTYVEQNEEEQVEDQADEDEQAHDEQPDEEQVDEEQEDEANDEEEEEDGAQQSYAETRDTDDSE